MVWRRGLAFALLAASTLPAAARTFCCNDDNGRRICSDVVPIQCQKRAYQEMNSQGIVARQYDAPLTAEQRALRAAEAVRKRDEERKAAEQRRLDEALRASYASVNDIEAKRDRLLAEAGNGLKDAQRRYDEALARKQQLAAELEFYAKKPVPFTLKAQIRENQAEIEDYQSLIETRRKEISAIRERFEDEKTRYLSLSGRMLPPAPAGDPRPR